MNFSVVEQNMRYLCWKEAVKIGQPSLPSEACCEVTSGYSGTGRVLFWARAGTGTEQPLLTVTLSCCNLSAASYPHCAPLRSQVTKTSPFIPLSAFFRPFLRYSHQFFTIHEGGLALNLSENLDVIFWFHSRPVLSKTCSMFPSWPGKKIAHYDAGSMLTWHGGRCQRNLRG